MGSQAVFTADKDRTQCCRMFKVIKREPTEIIVMRVLACILASVTIVSVPGSRALRVDDIEVGFCGE